MALAHRVAKIEKPGVFAVDYDFVGGETAVAQADAVAEGQRGRDLIECGDS